MDTTAGTELLCTIHINTPSVPETQLTAEVVYKDATNQHWVFVPADQIDEFLKENGTN
ncbi:uncharacterized protein FOMMEDRAFT_159604 [Fomitiporia mediterranea MF3/22]|uniref:uncharacterized protein n=1 Tax=Fomitiporia mediterranea (strain MF3/22) TaxID=694068 RepID=UPI00044075F0|nr:uncharacterized protein FOMMEDRAFT_159604 [Fomitiporia mediterranea MF3/22]EJD00024.1 hypothetical protein FOMMEDRAFT_159604 [Fomitiporia mediterranea MF3/22]